MKTLVIFFIAIYGLGVNQVQASQWQDISALESHAHKFLSDHFHRRYGNTYTKDDIEIEIKTIDPRLRLSQCDNFLTFEMKKEIQLGDNITLKASCKDKKPWSIYIPSELAVYDKVVVSKSNFEKGRVLQEKDLELIRLNIASLKRKYILQPNRIIGKELKRSSRAGAPIELSNLKLPDIIEKGQEIILESSNSFLTVQTNAIAMSAGHQGEQIRVKNLKSNRIVAATIISSGRVKTGYVKTVQ